MRGEIYRWLLAAVAAAVTLTAVPLIAPSFSAARAQTSAGPLQQPKGGNPIPEAQEPLRVQTSLVNLFATVRDKHKALVGNLTKDDFHIFENGQEQKVAYFERETSLPLTLGLLIDTSGSEERMLGAEQEAASRFLHKVLTQKDLAFVLSFDLDVTLLSDFTQDTARLESAIQRAQINAVGGQGPVQTNVGGTHLYDAIYLACRQKLAGEAGRKALIILTDAVDEGSEEKLDAAIEAAQRADTVIHVLYVADPHYSLLQGSGYGVAKKLAEETGGRVIEVRSANKIEAAFDEISQELRSQYVLGYYSTNATRDGSFRKIKVETTPADSRVLTRRGYYAPSS
jgi:VWFA-related protein